MQRRVITCLVSIAAVVLAAGLVEAGKGKDRAERSSFSRDLDERNFWVSGTVESARGDSLVVRIDDHGHSIPFGLASKAKAGKLEAGSRVSVRYRPRGSSGQTAEEVQVLSGPRGASLR